MVAERGIESDAGVEQRLVGQLKLVRKVLRPLGAVDVVADHQHELEVDALTRLLELRADLVLGFFAGAGVADDREADRILFERKRGLLRVTPAQSEVPDDDRKS